MKSSKNDTNYNHNLDDLMLKILSNKNECYENELFKVFLPLWSYL